MGNYAYTTLLATDDYVYGVIGLLFSLQEVQSKYPLHIIVTNNISDYTLSLLDEIQALYTIVPRVDFKPAVGMHDLPYALTLNKLHLFDLTQYDKICFIDGDVLIAANIDAVFDMDPPGFIVFKPTFLSGILMLFNPKSHTFKEFYTKFRTAGADEVIINHIYSPQKITDLSIFFESLIHMSNGGTGTQYKYWQSEHLDSIDKIKRYVKRESKTNFHYTMAILDQLYKKQCEVSGLLVP